MVKIKKTATSRHEATLSPATSEFAQATTSIPLYQIPDHLRSFRRRWPFPRGDLYHWIAVLNRFDSVLESFNIEYGLTNGPQLEPFGRRILLKGDGVDSKTPQPTNETLDNAGFSKEGDRELVEQILIFTQVLLENCGNRNLYSSSSHLNDLLHTSSLSLLKVTLKLCLRLAQRLNAQRMRSSPHSNFQSLLNSHYAINLDHIQKLAATLPRSASSLRTLDTPTKEAKGKRRQSSYGADDDTSKEGLVAVVTGARDCSNDGVKLSYYDTRKVDSSVAEASPEVPPPVTPTPIRQSSNLGSTRAIGPSEASMSDSRNLQTSETAKSAAANTVEISSSQLQSTEIHRLLSDYCKDIPSQYQFELLHRIRVALALTSGQTGREDIVAIRLLAVANLAYVAQDREPFTKVLQQDHDEPRRLQLPFQLAELIQPTSNGEAAVSRELQTLALLTLDAMLKHKPSVTDITAALNVNVNHGVLFYVVRKAVADLRENSADRPSMSEDLTDEKSLEENDFREALFAMLMTLPNVQPRMGENMVNAGLLEILAEILTIRTPLAEQVYPKVLTFFESFIFHVRDAFQAFANAKGLDRIADLTAYEVEVAYGNVQKGVIFPERHRTQLTDYQIPWYQQQSVKGLVKLTNRMLQQTNTNFDRLLRNLIDSPQLLRALKLIIENAPVFGATIWSTTAAVMTNFIHNEPTSYAVIAEAGLTHAFLEAVTQRPILKAIETKLEDDGPGSDGAALDASVSFNTTSSGDTTSLARPPDRSLANGILPATDVLGHIPSAFGAICLNEAGMELFRRSGAMSSFFEVFESPAHVKAMESDQEMAGNIGTAFDELLRHHPQLKADIMTAIRNMVTRIGVLCCHRASQQGVGAKMWLAQPDGKTIVAGGRDALSGPLRLPSARQEDNGGSVASTGDMDVEMTDELASPLTGAGGMVDYKDVVENEDPKNAPTTSQYISAICKFLHGFFANPNAIAAFAEGGGLESLLDFATMPSLPYNASDLGSLANPVHDLSQVIQPLVEAKPHLILPSLLKRTQAAVDVLAPLLEHTGEGAFFSVFTSTTSRDGLPDVEKRLADGTKFVKALVAVQSLCSIIGYAFQNQLYHHRHPQTAFSSVNLADKYAQLVDSLGKLHRVCIWEEVQLQKHMPKEWENLTRVKHTNPISQGEDEIDNILNEGQGSNEPNSGGMQTGEGGPVESPNTLTRKFSADAATTVSSAQFKNTRTLRFLLCRVPTSVTPLFHSLGKQLLHRRNIDPYQKQCAYIVADQIAKAAIDSLQYPPAKHSTVAKDRFTYWITTLSTVTRIMIDDSFERATFSQTLTLVLLCFKQQGGLEALAETLHAFYDEATRLTQDSASNSQSLTSENHGVLNLAFGGLKMILGFYTQIINGKSVTEASQTANLGPNRPTHDRDRPDFFSGAQFLVDLRSIVLKDIGQIWQSDLLAKCGTSIVKTVIDALKIIFDTDQENGARKKADPPIKRNPRTIKVWRMKQEQNLKKLQEEDNVPEDLAREALYRCVENYSWAREYCNTLLKAPGSLRNPIPSYELIKTQSAPTLSSSDSATNVGDGSTGAGSGVSQDATLQEVMRLVATIDADDVPGQAEASGHATASQPDFPMPHDASSPYPGPVFLTRSHDNDAANYSNIEDLETARSKLRSTLVEKALEILSDHNTVTFELCDLITVAVGKSDENRHLHSEIGTILLQSLLSLQDNETMWANGGKIAATAHLLGLVLKEKGFMDSIQEDLKESLQTLIGFIVWPSTPEKVESPPWIPSVLLVIELVLAEDAQPQQIHWDPPTNDDPSTQILVAVTAEPLIPVDDKVMLFKAVLEVLPRVGKDDALALAVLRVLVALTRTRSIATELSEKRNIQRLFLMAKQMTGMSNPNIQSAFLIILRHIVENESILRDIMRTEILTAFTSRERRAIDTTAYTRQLHHLVIRNPDIFLDVTNEEIELTRYDRNRGPQALQRKPKPKADEATSAGQVASASNASASNVDMTSSSKQEIQKPDKSKPQEIKCPVIEHPGGVIHYLLSELLTYKEVEDRIASEKSEDKKSSDKKEVEKADSNATQEATFDDEAKIPDKPEFKADEHAIFLYRCFILQCLTELLSSYNRAKVEFINFSRKADPHASTPSKPRSGILNYLLNGLLPVAHLGTTEDMANRKQAVTSTNASLVVAALCTRTDERLVDRADDLSEAEADPELFYVRRFVIEHALKAFKDANVSNEPLEPKYAHMMQLSELFNRMIGNKTDPQGTNQVKLAASQKQLARIMYEKDFIASLTAAIADIDLNFPGADKAVKPIMRALRTLTGIAVEISTSPEESSNPVEIEEEPTSSVASSISGQDEREETPDLYRNSTLGMLDPGQAEASESESDEDEDDDEDEDMYDDGYPEEMDYDEEDHDNEDAISDIEEDMGEMGPIEGLPGDVAHVELTIDEEDEDTDSDEDEDMDDGEDDEDDDDDMEEIEMMNDGIVIEEEDDEDDEDDVSGPDDDIEGGWHDGLDFPGQLDVDLDEEGGIPALDNLVRALEPPDEEDHLIERIRGQDLRDPEYLGAEDDDGDEEDHEDQDDFDGEHDFIYEAEDDFDEEEIGPPGGHIDWSWDAGEPPHDHHHHNHGRLNPFMGISTRDPAALTFRSHRPGDVPRATPSEGTNPLLQRSGRTPRPASGTPRIIALNDLFSGLDPLRPGNHMPGEGPVSFLNNLINAMGGHAPTLQNGAIHFSLPPAHRFLAMHSGFETHPRSHRTQEFSRNGRYGPADAAQFTPTATMNRWNEEAKILFGPHAQEKGGRVIQSILKLLVPPAIRKAAEEAKEKARKAKEAEEAREREEKERAEVEAQAKKEREEREAAEAEARARAAAEEASSQDRAGDAGVTSDAQAMEGVIQNPAEAETEVETEADTAQAPERVVMYRIHNREINIAALGIDVEYLEALPEELRDEVLIQRVQEQRAEATATGEPPADINPEFLNALPPEIREELLQQEAQERRRREREEARRRAAANGGPPVARAEEMDPASFLASLDPGLRQTILMDQDERMLDQLPPDIAREARALVGDRHLHQYNGFPGGGRYGGRRAPEVLVKRPKLRPAAQLLDKAGIATLMRLLFLPQDKRYLNETLANVCQNRQNRVEVISMLLMILQDGTADVSAVERSFAHLSIRAKQPAAQKTPQPKRSLSNQMTSQLGTSPLLVVQQCLGTLKFLASKEGHIASFFLSEHDVGSSLKGRTNKKGKGREMKAQRYPLNTLLGLLDRKIIIDSSAVMEELTELLQKITAPLQQLLKKEAEKTEVPAPNAIPDVSPAGEAASTSANAAPDTVPVPAVAEQPPTDATTSQLADAPTAHVIEVQPTEGEAPENPKNTKPDDDAKKQRNLVPPEIPESNLRMVINILAARECTSKTFHSTLSIISHLSAIPGAKETFGKELINQAQDLAHNILGDLTPLSAQISQAKSGTDVQGMALAKFSPSNSDQMKLLRAITALDYLFDPKKADSQNKPADSDPEGLTSAQRQDILTTLYESSTFAGLWSKLSECLTAIRLRGNMLNIATILQPLIEVLMLVCKNTTSKESLISKSQQKDFTLSSPPPESRMDSLFFAFTEEHRKILNELVRNSPKLMSSAFQLLVKNSKVLEFDNKRNYFNRQLHIRTDVRHPNPPLQLAVRRDQVFLDSFKALYFKSADEMKFGKLSIRFHNEEGVDAGGVTREWFQVLARQMFDPNYVLFNPVASDRTTFHPNHLSHINPEHLTFFKFIGRIIGKALYEGRVLDCHFSRAVYKRILGKPVSVKDMESLDLDYYKSLLWMLENDITDIITETFSTEADNFGDKHIIDLCENGRNIPVTEDNKHEYVRLIVEYRLTGSVKEQLENFLTGFHDIVPAELVSIFNEQELELLISGLPDIDVDDWKNNTDYHNYTAAAAQVQWFWRAVRSFDKEEQAKLLQFVTGTSKVPLNGFKELEGMNGFNKFNIHRDFGNKDRLPSAHTCFNQLDLPEYDNYEMLRERILTAITAGSEYFGFA